MKGGGRLHVVVAAIVLMAGCTSSLDLDESADDQQASTVTPSPERTTNELSVSPGAIRSFPSTNCGRFGRVPRRGQVTFVKEDRLYAAAPGEVQARCIGRTNEGTHPMWGGDADRLFVATSTGARVLFDEGHRDLSPSDVSPIAFGLSRPVGESVLFTSGDKRRLYKIPAAGGDTQDISFLRRHEEVIYHPAGRHILAVGVDRSGTYGIFVANNEGTEANLLVLSEDAKRVFSLTGSSITSQSMTITSTCTPYQCRAPVMVRSIPEVSRPTTQRRK